MTDAVAEKVTKKKVAEAPVQVPPPAHDPLYTHVIGTLEADLTAMRERALEAERENVRLLGLEGEIAVLRDQVASVRSTVDTMNGTMLTMNSTISSMWQIMARVFRQ